jgi:NTP pyrophosphatase (non-canonical NTP hydrolase)
MITSDGINDATAPDSDGWERLNILQDKMATWQAENFPNCQDWELALGVCEEAGELAQCILKLHRGMRKDEFDMEKLKDAIGDTVVFLLGVCDCYGWRLSEILETTSTEVLKRKW